MKKVILCILLFMMNAINPLYAESGIDADENVPEEVIEPSTKKFLTDYLIARFFIGFDMEKQDANWEEGGFIQQHSTPAVYDAFYDTEVIPLYDLMEKRDFAREIEVRKIERDIAYGPDAEVYFADITLLDSWDEEGSGSTDFRAHIKLCEKEMVCKFGLQRKSQTPTEHEKDNLVVD